MARDLRKEIYKVTKTYPKEETYRLKDQILRAARSSTANPVK
ncbi:MAG: four helix bundle protein [Candidatus Scalindua sediminis]|nr:four helix bundle protein [Candidatus Scalindua sediminis]